MHTDKEIVLVRFARKPCDLESVQQYARNPSATAYRAEVVETVTMTEREYDAFTSVIYKDQEWLDGKGGWLDEHTRAVVKVAAPNREPLFIDPSGFSYPRYVGMAIEHAETLGAIDSSEPRRCDSTVDELVTALEEAVREIEYCHGDMLAPEERAHPRGSGWARVYDRCRAALAKARHADS